MNAGLLRGVLLYPADNDRRLILADRLEQDGDLERADFVRLQLAIDEPEAKAREKFLVLLESSLGRRIAHLREIERQFNPSVVEEWLKSTAPAADWRVVLGVTNVEPDRGRRYHGGWTNGDRFILLDFRRGFASEVFCTLGDFTQHAAALFATWPIERVTLTDRRPDHVEREPGFPCWTWHNNQAQQTRHVLPQSLWLLIQRGWFITSGDAQDALSAACVRFGRLAAGLDVACRDCDGKGYVEYQERGEYGWETLQRDCRTCTGTGYVVNEEASCIS